MHAVNGHDTDETEHDRAKNPAAVIDCKWKRQETCSNIALEEMHQSLQIRCTMLRVTYGPIIDESNAIIAVFPRIRHNFLNNAHIIFTVVIPLYPYYLFVFGRRHFSISVHSMALISSFISGVNNSLLFTSPTL